MISWSICHLCGAACESTTEMVRGARLVFGGWHDIKVCKPCASKADSDGLLRNFGNVSQPQTKRIACNATWTHDGTTIRRCTKSVHRAEECHLAQRGGKDVAAWFDEASGATPHREKKRSARNQKT